MNGCSECGDLDRCKKGYYSVENEYVAKAAAMFIRRHGEVSYTSALRRAAEEGSEYPGSFDGTGSVEGALKLLEQYL